MQTSKIEMNLFTYTGMHNTVGIMCRNRCRVPEGGMSAGRGNVWGQRPTVWVRLMCGQESSATSLDAAESRHSENLWDKWSSFYRQKARPFA